MSVVTSLVLLLLYSLQDAGIGTSIDSFYEYLLKVRCYLLLLSPSLSSKIKIKNLLLLSGSLETTGIMDLFNV